MMMDTTEKKGTENRALRENPLPSSAATACFAEKESQQKLAALQRSHGVLCREREPAWGYHITAACRHFRNNTMTLKSLPMVMSNKTLRTM